MTRGRKPLEEKLTTEQKEYILREYPNTPCCEMAEKLGISTDSLKVYAHRNHIYKSSDYISRIRKEAGAQSLRTENSHRFPKGYIRQFHDEESREIWRRHTSEKMKDLWRKERLRVEYGLPQKTKLRVSSVPLKVRLLRYRLRKKGYILDDSKKIAYWDEHTRRSMLIERRKEWFSFKNVNDVNKGEEKARFVPEPPPVNDFFLFT